MIDLDNKTVLMLRLYKNRQAQVGREIEATYKKYFSNSFDEYRDARAGSRLEKHLKLSEVPSFNVPRLPPYSR